MQIAVGIAHLPDECVANLETERTAARYSGCCQEVDAKAVLQNLLMSLMQYQLACWDGPINIISNGVQVCKEVEQQGPSSRGSLGGIPMRSPNL